MTREPENGDRYVTWRDFYDKLDNVLSLVTELRTEQARQGAMLSLWSKLGPALMAGAAAAGYFGPDVASAVVKVSSAVVGMVT